MSSPSKPLKVLACPSATMILLPLEKLRVPDLEVSENGSKTFIDESNSLDKEYFDCIAEVVKSLN